MLLLSELQSGVKRHRHSSFPFSLRVECTQWRLVRRFREWAPDGGPWSTEKKSSEIMSRGDRFFIGESVKSNWKSNQNILLKKKKVVGFSYKPIKCEFSYLNTSPQPISPFHITSVQGLIVLIVFQRYFFLFGYSNVLGHYISASFT